MVTLIGISGKKQSGKSCIAEFIRDLYPSRTHIVALADALKREVADFCGVDLAYLEANKPDFRLMLQGYGTDFCRKHRGTDYWIRKYLTTCVSISKQNPNAIIVTPDIRFNNEALTILRSKGMLVRVERQDCDIDDQHKSETELDGWSQWDAVIHNNGTKEDLKQTVNTTLKQILKVT